MKKALVSSLVAIVAFFSLVSYTPVTAGPLQQSASVSYTIDRVADCEWHVYFQLSGFSPQSTITVTSAGTRYSCATGTAENYSWVLTDGTTDANGVLQLAYIHVDYGTYNYSFTDSAGRSASVTVSYPYQAVGIDIKPGGYPNSINCRNANGVIAVAILTTDTFNATTVDHTTVTFEGAHETHVDGRTGEPRRHEEDVDADGDIDLVFHFRFGDTALTCGSTEGSLEGLTFDGMAIQGTDSVRTVPS